MRTRKETPTGPRHDVGMAKGSLYIFHPPHRDDWSLTGGWLELHLTYKPPKSLRLQTL